MTIKPMKSGDPVSAKWLNELARMAGAGVKSGFGSGLITSGNSVAAQPQYQLAIFKASEDFEEHEDVYKGNAKLWWRDPGEEEYQVHGDDLEVFSHDEGVSEGDIFAAMFNTQSGRWERIGGSSTSSGGGGGVVSDPLCCDACIYEGSVRSNTHAQRYAIAIAGVTAIAAYDEEEDWWQTDEFEIYHNYGTKSKPLHLPIPVFARLEVSGEGIEEATLTLFRIWSPSSSTQLEKYGNSVRFLPLCGSRFHRIDPGYEQACAPCVTALPAGVYVPCLDTLAGWGVIQEPLRARQYSVYLPTFEFVVRSGVSSGDVPAFNSYGGIFNSKFLGKEHVFASMLPGSASRGILQNDAFSNTSLQIDLNTCGSRLPGGSSVLKVRLRYIPRESALFVISYIFDASASPQNISDSIVVRRDRTVDAANNAISAGTSAYDLNESVVPETLIIKAIA